MKLVFFGGEPLAVPVLEKLKQADLLPSLVVCNPDRPVGRDQALTPPPAKVWAEKENIPVFQPNNYTDGSAKAKLEAENWDLFVVVAYNFILPDWMLELPTHGSLNLHPSLLPKLRGASPIRSALLYDLPDEVGVTVMLLDYKMDTGPILEQSAWLGETWPIKGPELDQQLAELGGKLLAETIPAWVAGDLLPQEQNDREATYCHKLKKSDSELQIDPRQLPRGEAAKEAWRKICAFAGIGETFFIHNEKRVKVTEAVYKDGRLEILKVIPEGKSEMDFKSYLQSL